MPRRKGELEAVRYLPWQLRRRMMDSELGTSSTVHLAFRVVRSRDWPTVSMSSSATKNFPWRLLSLTDFAFLNTSIAPEIDNCQRVEELMVIGNLSIEEGRLLFHLSNLTNTASLEFRCLRGLVGGSLDSLYLTRIKY